MCDPVEEDTFLVDGVEMSNLSIRPGSSPSSIRSRFDHLGLLEKPYSMTKGGYMIIKQAGKVKEVFGSKAKERRFARENRLGHRSEFGKARGHLTKPRAKPRPKRWRPALIWSAPALSLMGAAGSLASFPRDLGDLAHDL